MKIRSYEDADFVGLDALWTEAFPNDPSWNHAKDVIPAKCAFQCDLLFVAVDGADVLGSIMAGYDGHRGWLYSVAVREKNKGCGLGTALVRTAEQALVALGCGKVNLQVRTSNEAVLGFYERLGYVIEDRISLGRRL